MGTFLSLTNKNIGEKIEKIIIIIMLLETSLLIHDGKQVNFESRLEDVEWRIYLFFRSYGP